MSMLLLVLAALVAPLLRVAGQTPVISDLSGYPGRGYSLGVKIGTPPQLLRVIIDTGSSNFAIATKLNPDITKFFNTLLSNTYMPTKKSVSVTYTEGYWRGILASDHITIDSFPSLTVQLVSIDDSRDFFVKGADWQGILGLAYPSLAKPDSSVTPVYDALVESGLASSNIFSMQLCGTVERGKSDIATGGKMVLNGTSSTLYHGPIHYSPIARTGYYEVTISEVQINGVPLKAKCTEYNNPRTIVDSGTTGLRFPTAIFNQIITSMRTYSTRPNAPSVAQPCVSSSSFWNNKGACCVVPARTTDLFTTFPNVTISLPVNGQPYNDFKLTIPPQLYLQAVPSTDPTNYCYKFFILPSDSGSVLGAVVMEGYYVIFDRQDKRIGFAASTCNVITPEFYKPTLLGPYRRSSNASCLYSASKSSSTARDIAIGVGAGVGILVVMVVIACVVLNKKEDGDSFKYSQSSEEAEMSGTGGSYRSGRHLLES